LQGWPSFQFGRAEPVPCGILGWALGPETQRDRKRPTGRAELGLAVRAELVDIGATTFHATLAADYILAVADDYLEAERERIEKDLQEVIDFCLATAARSARESWSAVGFLTPAPVGAAGVRLSYGESGV